MGQKDRRYTVGGKKRPPWAEETGLKKEEEKGAQSI